MQLTRRGKRAIMLISVLFMTVLTLMFVGAAVALAPSSVTRAQADLGLSAASRATQGGLDWARARISQDPRWNATTPATFTGPGLFVQEGDGQVTGWLQDNRGWSRFRIRFNYQDGNASSAPNSDGMNNPANLWSDFPYVSCNNLLGGSDRPVPLAESGSSYQSSGPWGNTQLTVPGGTLLLSVEGGHGGSVRMSGGQPVEFSAGYHKKVVQTVLKLGNNQPITEAAIMAAGDLALDALNSPVSLNADGNETARVRTKGALTVNGGVTSSNGEMLYGTTQTVNGSVSGVTFNTDDTSGFFKIPFDKVRAPVNPATLQAGVYVVTSSGQVVYHNMDYATYATTTPAPSGTPVALPSGLTLTGPHTAPTPKYRLVVTRDVQITPSGSVTDFALVPDGGAPQSANYGGVPSSSPAPPPPASTTAYVNYWFSPIATKPPLTDAGWTAWRNFADNNLPVLNSSLTGSQVHAGGLASNLTTYREYRLPNGSTMFLPNSPPSSVGANIYPWSHSNSGLVTALNNAGGSYLADLQAAVPLPGSPSPSPSGSPSASPTPTALAPKDLELRLQGGSAGLTLANSGKITIGAQIDGNGSALVSESDINLIGTSTDLSSSPGSQLGINLYSKGTITIDTYKLDSSGATFGAVNLRGVMYSWFGINVLAGNSNESAPFTMRGSMIAYGGDPAGNPTPGAARAAISASSIDITYDPAYVASLMSGGPFTLEVLSWHEF